jgi:hypothetical protein
MRLTVYFPEDSPTTHEFVGHKLTIGRLVDNDVTLDDGSVSGRHAEVDLGGDVAVLRDLGSTNGTFLNGEQVTGEAGLREGDEIYFGGVRSVFMEPAPAAIAESEEAFDAVAPAVAAPMFAVSDSGTGRPANFRYLSSMPRAVVPRDTLALVAWSCAGLGVLAAAYALFAIFTA